MHCFGPFLLQDMFLSLQVFAFERQNMTFLVNVLLTNLHSKLWRRAQLWLELFTSTVTVGLFLSRVSYLPSYAFLPFVTLLRESYIAFLEKFLYFLQLSDRAYGSGLGLFLWRSMSAKIQLLNFACTFGIRCCSFTICTYICNSTFKFSISLLQLPIWHCLFHNSTFKFTQFNIQVYAIQHPSLRNSAFTFGKCMFSISNRNPVHDIQCALRKLSKFSLCRG